MWVVVVGVVGTETMRIERIEMTIMVGMTWLSWSLPFQSLMIVVAIGIAIVVVD